MRFLQNIYPKHIFRFSKGGGEVNFNISSSLYFHFVIKFRLLLSVCGLHFWCPLNLKMLPTPLIWTVCTTCSISLLPAIMKVTKTSTVEREYSKITKNHQKLITKRIYKAPCLAQYTKIGSLQALSDSCLYWPWSMTVCPQTFGASFFHHTGSVHKVGRNTDQDVLRYTVRK